MSAIPVRIDQASTDPNSCQFSRQSASMPAHIFKPAKTAMQSGTAQSEKWLLVFDAADARSIDPLMGWTSTTSTLGQIQLEFATEQDAVRFAEANGIAYIAAEPTARKHIRKSYSDNFKFGRVGSWTH
jgi:hypothetical protein